MTSTKTPKIILGAGNVGDSTKDRIAKYDTPEQVNAFLNAAYTLGLRTLDTARNYSPLAPGTSEIRLGAVDAGARFTIDTKIGGPEISPPQWADADASAQQADAVVVQGDAAEWGTSEQVHTTGRIRFSVSQSVKDLRLPPAAAGRDAKIIDVMYLHAPDRNTPFEETCRAMDLAWREGKFRRFGLSNYTAAEVESIVAICKENGYVVPSVYQGQYNPIVRSGEKELFPVLRKHAIAFYAWSPAAAGTFAGNHRVDQAGGRFDSSNPIGEMYASMYAKSSIDAAIEKVKAVAAQHGLTGHAAALRWTVYHSALDYEKGDALVIGASSTEQLSSNVKIMHEGELPKEVADAVAAVSDQLGDDQTPYHF